MRCKLEWWHNLAAKHGYEDFTEAVMNKHQWDSRGTSSGCEDIKGALARAEVHKVQRPISALWVATVDLAECDSLVKWWLNEDPRKAVKWRQ